MQRLALLKLSGLMFGLLMIPTVVHTRYFLHTLVLAALYGALALSFDIVIGHVGLVSLSHPAFFGIGGYTTAILSTRFGIPFPVDFVGGTILGGAIALLAGIPFLRLSDISFAIGTLGFALMSYNVANSWIDLTRGPLCITEIPRLKFQFGNTGVVVQSVQSYYYLALLWLGLVALVYMLVTRSQSGRAMAALRQDEVLAMAFGIKPSRYRMMAFVLGAVLAAATGSLYARYVTVMCPFDVSTYFTINLLIMVFLGGVGTLRGVLLGAVVFTVLPEVARFSQSVSQLLYGSVLLAIVLRFPEGIEGVFRRLRRPTRPERGIEAEVEA